jgi:hypothetical protein
LTLNGTSPRLDVVIVQTLAVEIGVDTGDVDVVARWLTADLDHSSDVQVGLGCLSCDLDLRS